MQITPHRALSLAVASLSDSSRALDSCTDITDRAAFAQEIRAARDYLAALRDKETPDRAPINTGLRPGASPHST